MSCLLSAFWAPKGYHSTFSITRALLAVTSHHVQHESHVSHHSLKLSIGSLAVDPGPYDPYVHFDSCYMATWHGMAPWMTIKSEYQTGGATSTSMEREPKGAPSWVLSNDLARLHKDKGWLRETRPYFGGVSITGTLHLLGT